MKFSKSFSFFRGSKLGPNKFEYRTRFYDADKEDFEKRKKIVEQGVEKEKAGRAPVRSRSHDDSFSRTYRKQAATSNMRVAVIAFVLIILCYVAFVYIKSLENV